MPRSLGRAAALAVLFALLAVATASAAPAGGASSSPAVRRPRLVVLISIDQFRADYLTRFADLYLAPAQPGGKVGGFRWLMERGAYQTDAHHDHYPLYTGPGHSIHLTGALPYETGIVGNEWFDRGLGKVRYCVEDPAAKPVGPTAKTTAMSPATLRVSTVGDELEMATGGKARVWGLAFKDRAAILMAGRLADGVLWFDDDTGSWISSDFYFKDGKLPAWMESWNGRKAELVDSAFGKPWTLSKAAAGGLDRLWTPKNDFANPPANLGLTFPHPIERAKPVYKAFTTSPAGNAYVLKTAEELIRQEKLGKDETPDLLAINLSSNDYVGHAFGPDSAEVLDMAVTTDRLLSAFFNHLAAVVPGGLGAVTVVVTADHGVSALPAALQEARFPAGAYDGEALKKAAEDALDAAFGAADWTLELVEDNYYLNLDTLKAKGVAAERAEAVAAEAFRTFKSDGKSEIGIYAAYTRAQILDGRLPPTEIARRVARSFHPRVSGDVVLVADPFWLDGPGLKGTSHGSPYAYDTSVPILLGGFGIRPGRYDDRVSTLDTAATLSRLLGVLQPSGCEGHILTKALK